MDIKVMVMERLTEINWYSENEYIEINIAASLPPPLL